MAPASATTIVLFDVDGTLLLTGGAGVRAMNRAFEALHGVPNAFAGVSMAGRTDQALVLDAFARFGLPVDAGWLPAFRDRYCALLDEEIAAPAAGKCLMPGVRGALEALDDRPAVALGLVTGNFAEGARIKLGHFGLARYFPFGAFADDAADRNALVPVALARAAERGLRAVPPDRVFVVGDTPADVACALAAGVRAVGVATGPFDTAALAASGAHAALADLSDLPAFFLAIGL
jgi:phosphoglycolate phosphatase-like HAD superfamily hydrolase